MRAEPREIVCEWCGNVILTRYSNARFCSNRCQRENEKEENKRRRRMAKYKTAGPNQSPTIADVLAFAEQWSRDHEGEYPSYGRALMLMEREKQQKEVNATDAGKADTEAGHIRQGEKGGVGA